MHTVAGAHFDWSSLLGAAQALSLFADRQLVEIRIPSGKPGKDGSEALQRYCEIAVAGGGRDVITLVQLPRLDRIAAVERLVRRARPRRRHDPRRSGRAQGAAGVDRRSAWRRRASASPPAPRASARSPSSPTASRATCSPRTRRSRSSALLYPAGRAGLRADRGGGAQRRPLRRLRARRGGARRPGGARAAHARRPAQAEGEAAVLVHWTLAEDIRGLKRVKDALGAGKPLPLALREARVWGAKERVFERAVPLLSDVGARPPARGRARLRRPGQGAEASRLAARSVGGAEAPGAAAGRADRARRQQADRAHGVDGLARRGRR